MIGGVHLSHVPPNSRGSYTHGIVQFLCPLSTSKNHALARRGAHACAQTLIRDPEKKNRARRCAEAGPNIYHRSGERMSAVNPTLRSTMKENSVEKGGTRTSGVREPSTFRNPCIIMHPCVEPCVELGCFSPENWDDGSVAGLSISKILTGPTGARSGDLFT